MVDLLGVHVDVLSRHLNADDDFVLLTHHLLFCERGKAYLGPAIVRISYHEQKVNELVARLELANPIDSDLGYDTVHEHLTTGLVTRRDNLFMAGFALFDTLRQKL